MATGDITFGSEYAFGTSGYTNNDRVCKIDDTHIAIAYRDNSDSSKGKVVIGTIANGNQLSYGTAYTFNNAATDFVDIGLLDSTHIIVTFRDEGGDDYGIAMVGTINGSYEISFGSEYAFNAVNTYSSYIAVMDDTHFAIVYHDLTNTTNKTVAGVVSNGDEITYGSIVSLSINTITENKIAPISDSSFVVLYKDTANSDYATAKIGVISSDTTITYGSAYTLNSSATGKLGITGLDDTRFAALYYDTTAGKTYIKVGTIASDDEISYGSAYELTTAIGNTNFINLFTFDNTDYFAIVAQDVSGVDDGVTIVGIVANDDEVSFGTAAKFNVDDDTDFPNGCNINDGYFAVGYRDDYDDGHGKAAIGLADIPSVVTASTSDFFQLF